MTLRVLQPIRAKRLTCEYGDTRMRTNHSSLVASLSQRRELNILTVTFASKESRTSKVFIWHPGLLLGLRFVMDMVNVSEHAENFN